MRSKFLLTALGFMLSFPLSAADTPLPPAQLLQKLAMVLKGRSAEAADVLAFSQQLQTHPEAFSRIYGQWIARYQQSSEYATRLDQLHSVWWRIPAGNLTKHAAYVITHDQPYDEIFSRDYIFVDQLDSELYAGLMVQTLADLPHTPGPAQRIPLAPNESRFRGLLSSPEFLQVYPDTTTNVNRKRSSQVFRIAFCETLQNTLDSAPAAVDSGDAHGSSPNCMGCHRRLDPMARFFDQWRPALVAGDFPEYDPTQPSRGSVLLGAAGLERRMDGQADSELGRIVIQQPEFGKCTAKLAWQLVFGQDVALDAPTLKALEASFQSSHRFNILVQKALEQPFFWGQVEAPTLSYSDVQTHFMGCAGCHQGSGGTNFDPNTYPFRPDAESNAQLLQKIWGAINHRAGLRPMPESPRPQLPQENLQSIRAWIANGASDLRGQPSLNDQQVEEILQ